jgi:hypothetical protein
MNSLRTFLVVGLVLLCTSARASMPSFGFGDLEQSLRLTPEQKTQFDAAVAATHRALLSVTLVGWEMKDRVGAELAKPRPDPDSLARIQEDALEQTRPLFREAHVEWARLYAMLDPHQVRIARAYVEEKFEVLERATRAAVDEMSRQLQLQRR